MDPKERLQRLDIENIERVFLYPTLGLLWEPECEDLELTMAYARAYNRWIVDFCADSGGRLLPIAHIPFGIPELAEKELKRAADDGCLGFYSAPYIWSRRGHGHPRIITAFSPSRRSLAYRSGSTRHSSRIGRRQPASAT